MKIKVAISQMKCSSNYEENIKNAEYQEIIRMDQYTIILLKMMQDYIQMMIIVQKIHQMKIKKIYQIDWFLITKKERTHLLMLFVVQERLKQC